MIKLLALTLIFFLSNSLADILTSTYNIKWLGYSKQRENIAISEMLHNANRDLVLVQEVVAPPVDIQTDDKLIKGDREVLSFFTEMEKRGYSYVLSSEDTGTGDKIHYNSSATEWFVAFYSPEKLTLLEHGFIASDRSNHDDYERVPYWFNFQEISSGMDFIIISTHLKPGKGKKERARRYHELTSIFNWVEKQKTISDEKDYIVLGDMNIYDCNRLDKHLIDGFIRANKDCLNSNLKMNEPYDQVLYSDFSNVVHYEVIDMYKIFKIDRSTSNKEVVARYSDHHPVFFTIASEDDDD